MDAYPKLRPTLHRACANVVIGAAPRVGRGVGMRMRPSVPPTLCATTCICSCWAHRRVPETGINFAPRVGECRHRGGGAGRPCRRMRMRSSVPPTLCARTCICSCRVHKRVTETVINVASRVGECHHRGGGAGRPCRRMRMRSSAPPTLCATCIYSCWVHNRVLKVLTHVAARIGECLRRSCAVRSTCPFQCAAPDAHFLVCPCYFAIFNVPLHMCSFQGAC